MKKKALAAIVSLMIAGAATTVVGESGVRVILDGKQTGVELPGSIVSDVQKIIDRLGGISSYNREAGRLTVEKPDVNVLLVEGIQQTRNGNIVFSNPVKRWVDKDVPRNFGVFVEVDDAPVTKKLTLKVVLVGPDGKAVASGRERTFSTSKETSFYFSEPFISTKLDRYGTYKVQLFMKADDDASFVIAGENSFTVGR